MLQGVDVWEGNGVVDWAKVKAAGHGFAFARAAYGNVADKRAAANLAGIRAAGMAAGVYHFLRTTRDYQQQIDLMLAQIQQLGIGKGDLPPALDVEDNPEYDGPWRPADNDKYLTAVHAWIAAVEKLVGSAPILYTRASFWQVLGDPGMFSHCPLWVAHYGAAAPRLPKGWTDYAFWQVSDSGKVAGIGGDTDMNRFKGDAAALQALLLK